MCALLPWWSEVQHRHKYSLVSWSLGLCTADIWTLEFKCPSKSWQCDYDPVIWDHWIREPTPATACLPCCLLASDTEISAIVSPLCIVYCLEPWNQSFAVVLNGENEKTKRESVMWHPLVLHYCTDRLLGGVTHQERREKKTANWHKHGINIYSKHYFCKCFLRKEMHSQCLLDLKDTLHTGCFGEPHLT